MFLETLWYRIYLHLIKGNRPKWIAIFMASIGWATFINLAIMTLSALLAKMDIFPFMYPDEYPESYDPALILQIISAILALVYFIIRSKAIIRKFSNETVEQQKKGHKRMINYLIVLIVSIFVVAFIRPGYLPGW